MSVPFHRVITGHSSTGKAIFTNDDNLPPVNFLDSSKLATASDFGITYLFRTEGGNKCLDDSPSSTSLPISNTVPFKDPYKTDQPIVEPGHANWRIYEMPPGTSSTMHRTTSVDFGFVLKGEAVLELDDGLEKVLTEHSGVVQRGTIHAWHNRTKESTRIMFMILPSETVVVNGQKLADVAL